MKITTTIIRAIKAACREACGGRRKVEIGCRSWPAQTADEDGYNFLIWGDDNDLDDMTEVDNLAGKTIQSLDGWVALDCYCYNLPLFGVEPDDALDCNVYVLIAPDGKVAYASSDDLGHSAAIHAILERENLDYDIERE